MPSPFLRRPAVTSKVDVDTPVSVEPVPERVQGPVFAYRGMETHGVPPENEWRDPEQYDGYERGVVVDTEPPPAEDDPIPVRIVQEGKREIRRTTVFRAFATGTTKGTFPSNVVSSDFQARLRRSVKVKNLDTAVVYVATQPDMANAMHGWPLAQNEVWESTGEDDVWATGSAANEAQLAVTVEWTQIVASYGRD